MNPMVSALCAAQGKVEKIGTSTAKITIPKVKSAESDIAWVFSYNRMYGQAAVTVLGLYSLTLLTNWLRMCEHA